MWVVFSHQSFDWPWPDGRFSLLLRTFMGHGDIGVKIFFVLSGFILTHVYSTKESLPLKGFFVARFARVYPLYLAGLFVALPALILIQVPQELAHGGHAEVWTVLVVKSLCVLLLLQAWIPAFANHWNGVSWSLSAEAFFYTCFPFLLPRFRKMAGRWMLLVLAGALVVEIGREYILQRGGTRNEAAFLMFFPLLRIPDFATGMLLKLLHQRGLRPHPSTAAIAVLALFFGLGPFEKDLILRCILTQAGSAWLVLSLAYVPRTSSLLAKAGILLGQASYGTYLIHQNLRYISTAGMTRIFGHSMPYPVFLVALALVSILLYLLVETPARKWIRRRFAG